MNKDMDAVARAAWSNQADVGGNVDLQRTLAAIRTRETEIRRRDRIGYACAAMIAPAWAYAMWFMPDLRVPAAVGGATAVWIASQIYRRSGARLKSKSPDVACVEYQRALLQRERDLLLAMPTWYLVPIALAQIAILVALFTSPRIPRTASFPLGVSAFVGTVVTVLFVARRRWHGQAADLQRELDLLGHDRP